MDQRTNELTAQLIKEAHEIAVEKGWWRDTKRCPFELSNNFHAEVSEAWEEWRKFGVASAEKSIHSYSLPNMQPLLKPEGFWVEIADLLIRLADAAGNYGWQIEPYKSNFPVVGEHPSHAPEFIGALHTKLCLCAASIENNAEFVGARVSAIFGLCLWFAEACKINLWEVIEKKMAYNRQRPFRHGNKHA